MSTVTKLVRAGPPSDEPDEEGTEIELTEDGVARAFTVRAEGQYSFDHDAGCWFVWTGSRWEKDAIDRGLEICRGITWSASGHLNERDRAKSRRAAFFAGAERIARSDPAHAVRQEDWDRDAFALGCPGVTVDLKTGQSRSPDPADRITRQAAIAPGETSDCPLWLNFLDQVTGGDADLIRFLQLYCGYALTGDTREHRLLFLYGPGGNGKSVFLNTFMGIMGDYAVTAAMDTFTVTSGSKHPTDLAMLRGARLVSASETEEGRAWAESRIKQMTGGDPITAHFMRRDNFTYLPQFKLMIVGNHKPVLNNVDDAARRRLNIVPFEHRPSSPDRKLEVKLHDEWPGILRWIIDGCRDWYEAGLTSPPSVAAATEEYFSDQDMVGQWLNEKCVVELGNEHRWETSKDLYSSWRDFAREVGEDPGTQKRLGDKLKSYGLTRSQKRLGGQNFKAWSGVSLPEKASGHGF